MYITESILFKKNKKLQEIRMSYNKNDKLQKNIERHKFQSLI